MTRYTDRDAWTVAYHVGSLQGSSSYNKTAEHMYWYQLKNTGADVRVEAVDRFGNVYTRPNSPTRTAIRQATVPSAMKTDCSET